MTVPEELSTSDSQERGQSPSGSHREPEKAPYFDSQNPNVLQEVDPVFHALANLSPKDKVALNAYATFKMLSIRGMVTSADPHDLLHEAITRTLDHRRKWDPERIDFVTHLKGCMRSIASDLLARAHREVEAVRESERNQRKDEDDNNSPTQILERTRFRLQDDEVALQVFDQLLQGNRRAQICQALNMRVDVYDAARKRISRCLFALAVELRGEEHSFVINNRTSERHA